MGARDQRGMAEIIDDAATRAGLRASGSDRRETPRRIEEVTMHYATQRLLAAALAAASERRTGSNVQPETGKLDQLVGVADDYLLAEAALIEARQAER